MYKERITAIAKAAHQDYLNSEDHYDQSEFLCQQLDRITNYHNTVVNMEHQMEFQRFRLEGQDYRDFVEDLNQKRIMSHQGMIDGVIIVNRFADKHNIPRLYDGPVDEDMRYKDANTRFGIAEFADDYCSEMFKAGIGKSVEQEHKKVVGDLLKKAENIPDSSSQDLQKE